MVENLENNEHPLDYTQLDSFYKPMEQLEQIIDKMGDE